jgi:hypothetical protein
VDYGLEMGLAWQAYGQEKMKASQEELQATVSANQKQMKNGVFWVVTPCGSCKNRRFGGTWRLLHQGDKNR